MGQTRQETISPGSATDSVHVYNMFFFGWNRENAGFITVSSEHALARCYALQAFRRKYRCATQSVPRFNLYWHLVQTRSKMGWANSGRNPFRIGSKPADSRLNLFGSAELGAKFDRSRRNRPEFGRLCAQFRSPAETAQLLPESTQTEVNPSWWIPGQIRQTPV